MNELEEFTSKWNEEKFQHLFHMPYLGGGNFFTEETKNPSIARDVVKFYFDLMDKSSITNKKYQFPDIYETNGQYLFFNHMDSLLALARVDSRICKDILDYKSKKHYDICFPPHQLAEFVQQMKEGNLSAEYFFEKLQEIKKFNHIESSEFADVPYIHAAMLCCVEKDNSLAQKFLHLKPTRVYSLDFGDKNLTGEALANLSKKLDKLPSGMGKLIAENIKNVSYNRQFCQDVLFNVAKHDNSYLPQYINLGYECDTKEKAMAVAEIYEKLQDIKQKNESDDALSSEEKLIEESCMKLLSQNDAALKIALSKKYPRAAELVTAKEDEYVRMCMNNLEHPEKENVRSILNRLRITNAKTPQDFVEAVEFVHRRDMCKKICEKISEQKNQEFHKQNPDISPDVYAFLLDADKLSYAMAEAHIKDSKKAEKVVDLFYKMNPRPETYNSEYNLFKPSTLVKMTEMEDWMYPIIRNAARKGIIAPERLGSEKELFSACKAWKISPNMPKDIATKIGEMPLSKRMIAGAIIDRMVKEEMKYLQDENISSQGANAAQIGLNHNKKRKEAFWQEMAKVQEMPFAEAMKTYISDSKINRKRLVAAILEEMKVENSVEKFKSVYKKMENEDAFKRFLNTNEDSNTRAKLKEKQEAYREISEARKRLAEKSILPADNSTNKGHTIKVPVKDMSAFKDYIR